MTQTMPSERKPRLRAGKALDEALRLLRQLRFAANRSAFVKGEWVTISVDPRWSHDHTQLEVLVACHAVGRLQVDWQQLAVAAQSEDGKRSTFPRPFNAYGKAMIPSLVPGQYSLHSYEATGRVRVVDHAGFAALAAAGDGDEGEVSVSTSRDGRIRTTVSPTDSGVEVAFETNAPELAEVQVSFALVPHGKTGAEPKMLTVTLKPVPGKSELWEGVREVPGLPAQRYELVYEVAAQSASNNVTDENV